MKINESPFLGQKPGSKSLHQELEEAKGSFSLCLSKAGGGGGEL